MSPRLADQAESWQDKMKAGLNQGLALVQAQVTTSSCVLGIDFFFCWRVMFFFLGGGGKWEKHEKTWEIFFW